MGPDHEWPRSIVGQATPAAVGLPITALAIMPVSGHFLLAGDLHSAPASPGPLGEPHQSRRGTRPYAALEGEAAGAAGARPGGPTRASHPRQRGLELSFYQGGPRRPRQREIYWMMPGFSNEADIVHRFSI